jgi:hypothetical protein
MSDDLVGEEFTNRPEDDELAFLYYEKLYREPLEEALAELKENERDAYWDSYNHFMQTYVNSVVATVKALDLDILRRWVQNPAEANEPKNFRQIKYDIDSEITGIKIRYAQTTRRSSVQLTSEARKKIREFVNKIKLTIEGVGLPAARKDALMDKLNAFSAEVDRDRTRFEAFGALVIETAAVAGKAERKLRPIRRWLDSIAGVMREARMPDALQNRLPPPAKRIPAPPKQIAPPSEELWEQNNPSAPLSSESVEDDIPF